MSLNTANEYDYRRDRDAYLLRKDGLESEHHGKTALLHDGEVVSVEESDSAAFEKGCEEFGLGYFSTENIGFGEIKLGAVGIGL